MVPLLPLFGNPGLKQMLFTKAVAHPPTLAFITAKSKSDLVSER